MSPLRGCVVALGTLLIGAAFVELMFAPIEASVFPAIPLLIFGCVILVTAIAEPVYGQLVRRPPLSGGWRPTCEKFIDPTSGKPVEVWFDPQTGERRYVDVEGEKKS